jgi:hypothetical protein
MATRGGPGPEGAPNLRRFCQPVGMAVRATKGDENPRVSGIFDAPRQAGRGASRGPGGPPYVGTYVGWVFDRAPHRRTGLVVVHSDKPYLEKGLVALTGTTMGGQVFLEELNAVERNGFGLGLNIAPDGSGGAELAQSKTEALDG